jgi:hypothetical protein
MAILDTIDVVRMYVTFNKSMTIALLNPHIERATLKYLRPILGDAETDSLLANYPRSLTAAQTAMLPYAQRMVALYTVVLALPTMAVHFSDMGIQEVQSKDGSSVGLRQWVYFEVQGQMAQSADEAAEELLQFLEKNATNYPLWKTSTAYTFSHELFVNSATELSRYVDTRASRRIYLAVRPYMKNFVEVEWILPWIGEEQFAQLKTQIHAGTLTVVNEALVLKIRPVVAFAAMALAAPMVNIIFTGDGLRMPSTGNYGAGQSTKAGDIELRQRFIDTCAGRARGAQTTLQKFILDRIRDYPLIEASDTSPVEKTEQPYELPDQSCGTAWRVP